MVWNSGARACLIAMAFSSVSTAALAQSAPPVSPQDSAQPAPASPVSNGGPDSTAGDIIVTAQRRDESLARTPVAVQVVTSEALAKAQVKNELDLRFATPGLQIRSGQSSNSISFSLRGQSQDPQSDTRPGVLPYFNEIPLAGQGSTTAFYDLQSVQVVKGPQGTLFGRSATGGAVLYTTQKPTNDFSGYVSGLLGNYSARQAEGAINVPIVKDEVLLRVAGFYSERNGMQHNYFSGDRIGDMRRTGLRGSLTVNLGDRFHNTTVFDYFHAHGQNTQTVISGLEPFTGMGAPYLPGQFLYAGTATPQSRAIGIATLQAVFAAQGAPPAALAAIPGFYDAYFSQPNHLNTGLTGVLATQQAVGAYRPLSNGRNFYGATNYLVTNTTTFELSDQFTLKNIFGYYHSNTDSSMDVDSTPYSIQDNLIGPLVDTRQTTDELQLSGKLLDDRLSFVTGFFYSNEKTPYFFTGHFFDIFLGGSDSTYHHRGTSKTYALYGQGTYKLTDTGLSLTGGVRYTIEKIGKDIFSDDLNAGYCGTAGYDCNQSRTFKNFNYTFGVQDQISPELLLYATTRQAFKNGGFNGFLAPKVGTGAENGGDGFNSQRVRDVEVGTKYQGRWADLPVRANLALYYSWIRNDQRVAYVLNPAPGTEIVNVPRGRTYGLELDAQINPTHWLSVGGTFNYTHARFTNGNAVVTVTTAGGGTNTSSVLYDQVPDTPKESGSLFADVTIPVSDDVGVLLHGDVYHQAKSFGAPRSSNDFGTIIPKYTLGNFRLGLQDEKAGWSLTANLKNAFNKTYYVGVFALGDIYQVNNRIPGDRRTYTLEARFKF